MSELKSKRPASYQDVLDAPEHIVAEILHGELRLSPRPATPASIVASNLHCEIGPPFGHGRGGPGGWIVIIEPELHLGDDILVPDLAAWRRERMPVPPHAAFIELAPDWVCEVLSPSTRRYDRLEKLPAYAAHGVGHAWLVDPRMRSLEAFRRVDNTWLVVAAVVDDARARVEPFDAIELDLASLWADVPSPPPPRANEPGAATFDYDG